MRKILLTLMLLAAGSALAEKTESPTVIWNGDVSCCHIDVYGYGQLMVYLDGIPYTSINFDGNYSHDYSEYYDGEYSHILIDLCPFGETTNVELTATAQEDGKEISDVTLVNINVSRPVIVEGAYIYAYGIDDENGLQVHICSDPSYGYDFMFGDVVLDGFKYQINHSGEWLQYDINASTINLPEYGDYEIDAYGYAEGHGRSATATAWIHYDAEGYTSYSQPRDYYYQYYVHNDVVYYILNDSTVCVSEREIPQSSPSFGLPHPTRGDIVIPATFNWNEKTYTVTGIGKNAFNPFPMGESEMTSVSIPNTVTYIGEGAFNSCKHLTSIVIPDAVTAIDSYTFSSCYSLTNITIPDAVTSISNRAFNECVALTNITIPDAVTAIGSGAFFGCTSLNSITIPNAVTTIGDRAFNNCGSLTRMEVDSDNTIYDSRDNCNAVIETASNTLIAGCMNTLIPNSVTAISEYAFNGCTGLINLTIPNSVTAIGDDAFFGCSSMSKISFGEAVSSIGIWVFHGCNSLTSIICRSTIPATVTEYTFNGYSCDIYTQATLFVPAEALEAYQTHEEWGKFSRIVPFIGAGPGDVNGDGNIAISDATSLIDMLLGSDELPAWADVNGDGNVTIADVTVLIDMLLNGN